MTTEPEMLRQTLADYNQLVAPWPGGRPALTLVAVVIKAEPHDGQLPKTAVGWVRHRSAVGKIGSADLSASDVGPAILGEWRVGENQTIHLRPDPDRPGQMCQVTYTVRSLPDGEALKDGEIACLRQEIAVLAPPLPQSDPGSACPVLLYHAFWGGDPDDPLSPRRLFTIFAGFGDRNLVIAANHDPQRAKTNHQATP